MSKLVITLIGLNNESAGRLNIRLEGLPDDLTILPEVVLHELDCPTVVRGIQVNGVPQSPALAAAFDDGETAP